MKNYTFKNLIFALALILSASVLLSYLNQLGCDGCLELKTLSKIILAGISIAFILRYGFGKILQNGMRVYSIWTLVAAAIMIMAFLEMERIILNTPISTIDNIKFFASTLSTGFFEEVFFRVFMFYFILRMMKNRQNAIWKSTLWASFCFGLAHSLNALSGLDIVSSILLINFAVIVGIILQSIYIRTNSIVLISVLHGMINYFGTYNARWFRKPRIEESLVGFDWLTLIGNLAALGIIALIFIVPIRRYLVSTAHIPEANLQ